MIRRTAAHTESPPCFLALSVSDAAEAFAEPAPQPQSELDALTAREREVLQHIARGYMYKIALRLTSPRKPSRRTCPRCCASCSSPAATS